MNDKLRTFYERQLLRRTYSLELPLKTKSLSLSLYLSFSQRAKGFCSDSWKAFGTHSQACMSYDSSSVRSFLYIYSLYTLASHIISACVFVSQDFASFLAFYTHSLTMCSMCVCAVCVMWCDLLLPYAYKTSRWCYGARPKASTTQHQLQLNFLESLELFKDCKSKRVRDSPVTLGQKRTL